MPLIPFGQPMRDKYFLFDKDYHPLNHGSYGALPAPVRDYQQSLQNTSEARLDPFTRITGPSMLLEARAAIAKFLNVPIETAVFVPNATTGVNTVLRSLTWDDGDTILYFNTTYGACQKTIQYICETTKATSEQIDLTFPVQSPEKITTLFQTTVERINATPNRRVKLALIDTVLTFPGVRMPWEQLATACKAAGILSLFDAAHAVGHIDLQHLTAVDPDFFTSNCHKWLFTPRACAVLYIPKRNHHLIRSTLPTSHGFKPLASDDTAVTNSDNLGDLFAWTGTSDMTAFLSVPTAIEFREKICGGEQAIREYCFNLAHEGGQYVAQVLGTEVMAHPKSMMAACCFAMVRLPLELGGADAVAAQGPALVIKMMRRLMTEYDTFMSINIHAGAIWVRISAQIYLDMADFAWAAEVLKQLCHETGQLESKL